MSNEKTQDKALVSFHNITQKQVIDLICPTATGEEAFKFIQMCKANELNPFTREAYLVKYGDNVQMLTSHEVFIKRAFSHPKYRGFTITFSEDFKECTCSVRVEGYDEPISATAYLEESIQTKKDGKPTQFWKKMPKGMLEKCAISKALRRAFPDQYSGLYTDVEIDPNAEPVNITPKTDFEDKGSVEMPAEKVKAEVVDDDNNVIETPPATEKKATPPKTTKTKATGKKKMTATEKNALIQKTSQEMYKQLMEMNDKDHDKSLAQFTEISGGETTFKGLELEQILEIGKKVGAVYQLFLDNDKEEPAAEKVVEEDVPF